LSTQFLSQEKQKRGQLSDLPTGSIKRARACSLSNWKARVIQTDRRALGFSWSGFKKAPQIRGWERGTLEVTEKALLAFLLQTHEDLGECDATPPQAK